MQGRAAAFPTTPSLGSPQTVESLARLSVLWIELSPWYKNGMKKKRTINSSKGVPDV
jgi:hypothetical protein